MVKAIYILYRRCTIPSIKPLFAFAIVLYRLIYIDEGDKRLIRILLVSLLILFIATPFKTRAVTDFSDNFESGLSQWTVISGSWSISNDTCGNNCLNNTAQGVGQDNDIYAYFSLALPPNQFEFNFAGYESNTVGDWIRSRFYFYENSTAGYYIQIENGQVTYYYNSFIISNIPGYVTWEYPSTFFRWIVFTIYIGEEYTRIIAKTPNGTILNDQTLSKIYINSADRIHAQSFSNSAAPHINKIYLDNITISNNPLGSHNITVEVRNISSGAVISGATVDLYDAAGTFFIIGNTTNGNGQTIIYNQFDGYYKLRTSANNYYTRWNTIYSGGTMQYVYLTPYPGGCSGAGCTSLPSNMLITAIPEQIFVGVPTNVNFTATDWLNDSAISNALINVSGCGFNYSGYTDLNGNILMNLNALSAGDYYVNGSKSGYYNSPNYYFSCLVANLNASGHVYNASSLLPVQNAKITLDTHYYLSNYHYEAFTDYSGSYSFYFLADSGAYQMCASANGYYSKCITKVINNNSFIYDFFLNSASISSNLSSNISINVSSNLTNITSSTINAIKSNVSNVSTRLSEYNMTKHKNILSLMMPVIAVIPEKFLMIGVLSWLFIIIRFIMDR